MSKLSPERRAELDALARQKSGSLPAESGRTSLDRRLDDRDSVVSIFGGAVRKGAWEPPERLSVVALFGGVKLDFSQADMLEGVSRVDVFAAFGGVEIRVPPDIHVETRGLGIFGGFGHYAQRAPEDDAPLLRIHGLALFGGVEVKPAKPRA